MTKETNQPEGKKHEVGMYRNKPIVVEAMRLTFENQEEVKKWCGGKTWIRPPMRAVTGITLAVNFNVPFGYYIFKDADGSFHYCTNDIFQKTYVTASSKPEEGDQEKENKILRQKETIDLQDREIERLREALQGLYNYTKGHKDLVGFIKFEYLKNKAYEALSNNQIKE